MHGMLSFVPFRGSVP